MAAQSDEDKRRGVPPPPSVHVAWALSLIAALAALIVALALSQDSANWVRALYSIGLIAVVLGVILLAYKVEKRRRFVYGVRSYALDVALGARIHQEHLNEETQSPLEQKQGYSRAFAAIQEAESALADTGAYADAAIVAAARRQLEQELSVRRRPGES